MASLKAWRRAPEVDPAASLPGLIAQLRRRGCTRLQVTTIAESAFGRALRRAGFIPRADTVPILAKALTPAGAAGRAARGRPGNTASRVAPSRAALPPLS